LYSTAWAKDIIFSDFEPTLWSTSGRMFEDFYNKVAIVSTTKLHLIGVGY